MPPAPHEPPYWYRAWCGRSLNMRSLAAVTLASTSPLTHTSASPGYKVTPLIPSDRTTIGNKFIHSLLLPHFCFSKGYASSNFLPLALLPSLLYLQLCVLFTLFHYYNHHHHYQPLHGHCGTKVSSSILHFSALQIIYHQTLHLILFPPWRLHFLGYIIASSHSYRLDSTFLMHVP